MNPELDLLIFPIPGLAGAMAANFEGAGWDGIYMADTQNLTAEVYVSLGVAAASTERIKLATGVTNPVTRHPAVAASSTRSDSKVRTNGSRPRKVTLVWVTVEPSKSKYTRLS